MQDWQSQEAVPDWAELALSAEALGRPGDREGGRVLLRHLPVGDLDARPAGFHLRNTITN